MSACPEDETLLAMIEGRVRGDALSALDSHLDACSSCRAAVAMLGSGPRRREHALARGEALGRFLVIERVGEGAMGVVYAAFDPELERKVALKVLHAERGDAKARARLVREAQAMARLSHPNVVTVYDFYATVLHLLVIDHEKLTRYHNGAARRLTDVHGHVVHDVLA